jgi:transcriptional regulator with XRE-family HTH domain
MPTKEELGRRLRGARFERNLTLKQVATRCGMSATHISEVERGKTSPTIGALQRIAAALGEKPSFFVREDILEPVTFTPAGDRCDFFVKASDGSPSSVQILSKGIPGGCLQLMHKSGPPGEQGESLPHVGELVMLCTRGSIRFTVGTESWTVREGDTIQLRTDDGFTAEVVGEEAAEGLWILAAPVPLPM